MATRGRFARSTGGSNISTLIYDIMRTQYSRTVSALIAAYKNQVDYRGGGVPTASDVISYLREYANNSWITQNDRDGVSADIADIQRTERTRQENIMVNAINENPSDSAAIQTYISFLKENIDSAETPTIKAESEGKLFDASKTLIKALGTAFNNGAISTDSFDSQVGSVVSAYSSDAANYREMLSLAADQRFTAQYNVQNTLLATASGQGAAAYNNQLRKMKQWLLGVRSSLVQSGLATTNTNGDIVGGADIALTVQRTIGQVNEKLLSSGTVASQTLAAQRIADANAAGAKFLNLVNFTLGSNYSNLEDFVGNQLDVNRFYSVIPTQVMQSDGFMNQDTLVTLMFGDGDSVLNAKKTLALTSDSAASAYAKIVGLSKNYGRNTLVDDAAILMNEYYMFAGNSRGDAVANTRKLEDLVARYQDLLAKNSSLIQPEELKIHERTLAVMQAALNGQTEPVDGPTAYDLANPNAAQYDYATGQFTSAFGALAGGMAADANTAREVADGTKIQVGVIGADGKWQYREAVSSDPTIAQSQGVLPIVDKSSGVAKLIGAAGFSLVTPSSIEPGKFDPVGRVYNLGNGNFVVESLDASNGMSVYDQNYDPYTGKYMTWSDFSRRYVSRTAAGEATGNVSVTTASEFVVPELASGSDRTSPTKSREDFITSSMDKRINDLRSNPNLAPDAVDRIIGYDVKDYLRALAGTPYEQGVQFRYKDIQMPKMAAAPKSAAYKDLPKAEMDSLAAFRAGERADRLTAVAFRNAPAIANVFSPEQTQQSQNTFRAGERGRA